MCERRFTTYEVTEGQYAVLRNLGQHLRAMVRTFEAARTLVGEMLGYPPYDPLADDRQREAIRHGICRRFDCEGQCPMDERRCDRALALALYSAGVAKEPPPL
jgi:hypothetical protein